MLSRSFSRGRCRARSFCPPGAGMYAVTRQNGADVNIDPVGGDVFDASLRSLAWAEG